MSAFSDYLENAIGNHVFQNAVYAQPTQLLLALYNDIPQDNGTGTEVSGTGYAREDVTAITWNVSTGQVSNGDEITFPQAAGPWGEIQGAAIFDQTGTNMLYRGALQTNKTVDLGDTARFPAGTFTIQHD